MKIVSLYWGYMPGGIGKYGLLFNQAVEKSELSVRHVCIRSNNWITDFDTLQQLNASEIIINSRKDFSWIKNLKNMLELERPEFIITHGFNAHFVIFFISKLLLFKPQILVTYHGRYFASSPLKKPLELPFNIFTEWYIGKFSKSTAAVSEFSKNYLLGKGVKSNRVIVIHNGIDQYNANSDNSNLLRKSWPVEENAIVLGVIARLDVIKGINYLLDAFSELVQHQDNLFLVIVGNGPEEGALKRQVHSLEIDHSVLFVGYKSEVYDYLKAFDIFLLPSLAENHSISLLEAMQMGKTIVATDVGGNTESVRDRQEALIIPSADSKAIVCAVDELLADSTLCETLALGAKKRFLAEFTVERMVNKTANWLSSLG